MVRSIAHLDMDTFFVACERQRDSRLSAMPLIVGGGSRGVVASCSYEARRFGVRSAMPMRQALQLCPQAKVIKGDMELYSKMSHLVTDVIADAAPVMEKASIDEFYLDLSGMDRFIGTYKWIIELSERITRETGLPNSFALSVNKTVSKIATGEYKPGGHINIPDEMVRPFLNPLSVRKMPGVGENTANLLTRIGVRNIQTLAEMPADILQQLMGKTGIDISKKARGIDLTPVRPYNERKSLSTEQTFREDTIDIPRLRALLDGMAERLCYDLRAQQWLASTVTVKVRYANFDTETRQKRIAYTSSDQLLSEMALSLFDQLYDRRMRLRLVGLQFSGLVRGLHQIDLFSDDQRELALYRAMDRIKDRFGRDAIARCGGASFMNLRI